MEHQAEKQERGRPHHLYRLTDEAHSLFPTTYANFAVELMHEVAKFNGPGFINKVFRSRMQSQMQTYQQRVQGKTLPIRVKELALIRDEEGYMARVNENGTDYFLIEHNCPIAAIADEYPHICEIETGTFPANLRGQSLPRRASAAGQPSVLLSHPRKPPKTKRHKTKEISMSNKHGRRGFLRRLSAKSSSRSRKF